MGVSVCFALEPGEKEVRDALADARSSVIDCLRIRAMQYSCQVIRLSLHSC